MGDDLDGAIERLYARGDEEAMQSVAIGAPDASDEQLARLANVLATSGDFIASTSDRVCDIASTGGPGSLSTLLSPLFACALGARVAKIAVPGRPAGGLDVLGSLAGFRTELSVTEARDIYEACGYVHTGAGQCFCPLDAQFFAWRQANGQQAVPTLAIASLLAKKLAAGAGRVVLDVRVGSHGNFGATLELAKQNSQRFVSVARQLAIEAVCVLTLSDTPVQPWIGRGEALVALSRVLTGRATGVLEQHAIACVRMAEIAAGVISESWEVLIDRATVANERMLLAHGSDAQEFWSTVQTVSRSERASVVSETAGHVSWNVDGLRAALVNRQLEVAPNAGHDFSDPCGVLLSELDEQSVEPGVILAGVRDVTDPVVLADRIAEQVCVADLPGDRRASAKPEVIGG